MPTATQIRDKFSMPHSAKRVYSISPTSWTEQPDPLRTLNRVQYRNRWYYETGTIIGQVFGTISEADIAKGLTWFETLGSHGDNHSDIKNDIDWQNMYLRAKRKVLFMTPGRRYVEGPATAVPTYPCHYCGILLPEELIQVDHRHPKVGGTYIAALKCLRAIDFYIGIDLVQKAAKGRRVKNLIDGNIPCLNPRGLEWGHTWTSNSPQSARDRGKQDRYRMTEEGITFYSVCNNYYGRGKFAEKCVNSFLNLAPACARCNGSAGKSNTLFPR